MDRRVRHGKDSTYVNHGCRCPACRAAHAKYQRQWKAKVKEAR